MKAKLYFKIGGMLLILSSCNKKENSIPMNSVTQSDKDFYVQEALTKGDTSAYYNLSVSYMDGPIENLLYPALIMANKYDYHLAYADVYHSLTSHNHQIGVSELEYLDDKTRNMALEYLIKGAEKKNKECQSILGKLYIEGKYIKKDVSKGQELLKYGER